MKIRVLERCCDVAAPLAEVFPFFAEARNLEELTPPWLRFEILGEPPAMAEGARIDYRIRLRGLPMRWRTRIAAWQPETRFVDEQVRGPYRLWRHEHRFEPLPGGGTRLYDRVEYALPALPFEGWFHDRLVAPDLAAIFDYRQEQQLARFGPAHAPSGDGAAVLSGGNAS